MEQTVNERIKMLIEKEKLNPNSFSVRINANAPTTNKIIKGQNNPGYEYLCAVLGAFPELNANWLLMGRGQMMISENDMSKSSQDPNGKDVFFYKKLVNALEYSVELQKDKIKTLQEDNGRYEQMLHKNEPSQKQTTTKHK